MVRIVDKNNLTLDKSVQQILQKVLQKIQHSGKTVSDALKFTTQRHFQTIYPGSKHYSPNKVVNGKANNGSTVKGEIVINVPGITRCFRNLVIKPVKAKALTIPLHRSAYGKKASEFSDLFIVKKKDGKAFLARHNSDNTLTFMYQLRKSVFQRKDRGLLPSDKTYSDNVFSRIQAYLKRSKL